VVTIPLLCWIINFSSSGEPNFNMLRSGEDSKQLDLLLLADAESAGSKLSVRFRFKLRILSLDIMQKLSSAYREVSIVRTSIGGGVTTALPTLFVVIGIPEKAVITVGNMR
jgi:hypothetical protein